MKIQPKKDHSLNPYEEELQVGQLFLTDSGGVIKIGKIENGVVTTLQKWNGEWSSYGTAKKERFYGDRPDYIRLFGTYEQEMERAIKMMQNLDTDEGEIQENDQETALATPESRKTLERIIAINDARRKDLEKARRLIERKRSEMYHIMGNLYKQMSKIRKIIEAFELYLGINEDIVQIQTGDPAPVETPISLRQQILYMDEEVGDPRRNEKTGQPGIDWQSVEDFDHWLLMGNHLDKVFPESKGMVILKPSRQRRTYSDNVWINLMMDEKNHYAYLLIRNGDQVWRVFTNTNMGGRFFPTVKEMEDLLRDLEDENYRPRNGDEETSEFVYKRNALIVQGLIDRTEILQPMLHHINIGKPETYADGYLSLVRDDESLLPDGRLPFRDWMNQINSQLKEGSRAVVSALARYNNGYRSSRDLKDRFLRYYAYEGNLPDLPEDGIYQVEKIRERRFGDKEDHDQLVIRYNPGDEVTFGSNWEWDPHVRKHRVAIRIYERDQWIINFDQIDLDDIDFYLNNRTDRGNYLSMIPVLWSLRDELLREKADEQHFVNLVSTTYGLPEDAVWTAVDWWKTKNKWKRNIRSDDAKALRMIVNYFERRAA